MWFFVANLNCLSDGSHFSNLVHPHHSVWWAIETLHMCVAILVTNLHIFLPLYPLPVPKLLLSTLMRLCVATLKLVSISAVQVSWSLAMVSGGSLFKGASKSTDSKFWSYGRSVIGSTWRSRYPLVDHAGSGWGHCRLSCAPPSYGMHIIDEWFGCVDGSVLVPSMIQQ